VSAVKLGRGKVREGGGGRREGEGKEVRCGEGWDTDGKGGRVRGGGGRGVGREGDSGKGGGGGVMGRRVAREGTRRGGSEVGVSWARGERR